MRLNLDGVDELKAQIMEQKEMSTNKRRFTTINSLLGRIGDWLNHAWGMIKPGPLAWKGSGLGLLMDLGGLAAGATWLLDTGQTVGTPPNVAAMAAAHVTPLDMPDSSQLGPYEARMLFYGSGQN